MYGETALDAMTAPLSRTGCVRESRSACEVFDDTRNLSFDGTKEILKRSKNNGGFYSGRGGSLS